MIQTIFLGYSGVITLVTALVLSITVIAAPFNGRRWLRANMPGFVILLFTVPWLWLAGLYLLQLAGLIP